MSNVIFVDFKNRRRIATPEMSESSQSILEPTTKAALDRTLAELENELIEDAFKKYKTFREVAQVLGMSKGDLIAKVKKYNLKVGRG